MPMRKYLGLSAILFLTFVGAQKSRSIRLVKPWSQLTGLSSAQKEKIFTIHRQAREEIKKILSNEHRQCMAVLTQDQLNQLQSMEEKKTVDRKKDAAQSTSN